MAIATNGDVSLYYAISGERATDDAPAGETAAVGDGGECVVFVPEAGLGGWSWGWQHAALAGPVTTLVWDLRGTGRSDAPPGPYDLETLAADLERVLRSAGVRRAHVVGAGLGAAVALTAARTSTRIETLALFGCGTRDEQFDLEPLFAPPANREALRASTESVLSAGFCETQSNVVDGIVDWRADGDAEEAGWRAQVDALGGFDVTDWGYEVTHPALVCHGTDDDLVPVAAGRELADALPRSAFEPIDGAGHLAFVERSREVNDRLVGFLEAHARGLADGN